MSPPGRHSLIGFAWKGPTGCMKYSSPQERAGGLFLIGKVVRPTWQVSHVPRVGKAPRRCLLLPNVRSGHMNPDFTLSSHRELLTLHARTDRGKRLARIHEATIGRIDGPHFC